MTVKTNVRKHLTHRQRVLQIHPNAEFWYGSVQYRAECKGFWNNYYETVKLCDRIYDSKKAWKAAWEQILKDMVDKLESA